MMTEISEEPASSRQDPSPVITPQQQSRSFLSWLRDILGGDADLDDSADELAAKLRQKLDQVVADENGNGHGGDASAGIANELTLVRNVLKLTELDAEDVMIPRADIVSLDVDADEAEILNVFAETPRNRIPVYRETLDDIVGILHIKDVLIALAKNKSLKLSELATPAMIVVPSKPALDLLVTMRETRQHAAIVVDEYGGVDGMVTIGDLVEAIVGELSDPGDSDIPQLVESADGKVIVDAKLLIEEFEERYGDVFPENEHEDIDSMGGLALSIAGRMPTRGELLKHEGSGLTLEVLDADPRRIKRLRVHGLSAKK